MAYRTRIIKARSGYEVGDVFKVGETPWEAGWRGARSALLLELIHEPDKTVDELEYLTTIWEEIPESKLNIPDEDSPAMEAAMMAVLGEVGAFLNPEGDEPPATIVKKRRHFDNGDGVFRSKERRSDAS